MRFSNSVTVPENVIGGDWFYPSFYSSHTLHLINKRDTLCRMKKNLDWVLIFKFCLITNEISESIELDKATFLDTINLTDIRHCFKYLRSMKTSSVYPSVLECNGYKAHSIVEKVNVFNNYFCSRFGPATQITIVLSNNPSIILSDSLVAVSEFENMPKECDDPLSARSDNIPAFVLHHSASILAPLVLSLFQCIVETGIWPDEWKTAFIIPLRKNGSISLAQNYRPISISIKLSLVFERMVFRYIYHSVRAQIFPSQHGFITSRDRPKSAPYPRLKNSKTTSKCQVLFYSTRKSKFFEKKFFEKITYSKKMDRVARRGSLARAPGALKSHNAEKLKGRTL